MEKEGEKHTGDAGTTAPMVPALDAEAAAEGDGAFKKLQGDELEREAQALGDDEAIDWKKAILPKEVKPSEKQEHAIQAVPRRVVGEADANPPPKVIAAERPKAEEEPAIEDDADKSYVSDVLVELPAGDRAAVTMTDAMAGRAARARAAALAEAAEAEVAASAGPKRPGLGPPAEPFPARPKTPAGTLRLKQPEEVHEHTRPWWERRWLVVAVVLTGFAVVLYFGFVMGRDAREPEPSPPSPAPSPREAPRGTSHDTAPEPAPVESEDPSAAPPSAKPAGPRTGPRTPPPAKSSPTPWPSDDPVGPPPPGSKRVL
jgi:hypothetical protein